MLARNAVMLGYHQADSKLLVFVAALTCTGIHTRRYSGIHRITGGEPHEIVRCKPTNRNVDVSKSAGMQAAYGLVPNWKSAIAV